MIKMLPALVLLFPLSASAQTTAPHGGTFYPFIHGTPVCPPGHVDDGSCIYLDKAMQVIVPAPADGNIDRCYKPPYDCPAVRAR